MPRKGTVSEPDTNAQTSADIGKWTPEAIRDLRLAMGLSQTKFGKKLPASRGSVSDWEAGKSTPSVLYAAALDRLESTFDPSDNQREHIVEFVPRPEVIQHRISREPKAESVQHLAGRSIEIEALFAYVTQRQRELSIALQSAAIAEGIAESLRRSAEEQAKAVTDR